MSGYVKAQRDRFDHPLFQASAKNPYCPGYAWDWLVANASWRERRLSVGGKTVTLRRGQLCHSIRHLASVWGWSKSATERFLLRLKSETMIETDSETGQTIITICNYDKYQSPDADECEDAATAKRDSSGTAAGQQRDNKEEIKELKKEDDDTRARELDHLEVLKAAGIDSSKDISGKWFSSSQIWEAKRWMDDLGLSQREILLELADVASRSKQQPRSLSYFTPSMQDLAGRKKSPALQISSYRDVGRNKQHTIHRNGQKGQQAGAFGFLPERC